MVLQARRLISCYQCQVIALNTLSKGLACQMLFLREFSDMAALIICGQHSDVKGR